MKYHNLPLTSHKNRKRVGRGIGSGYGKTAGRGTKGQRARSGASLRPGFEGGQNPLAKRLPKLRGSGMQARHKSPKPAIVFTDQLDKVASKKATITPEVLAGEGFIKAKTSRVKLLLRGQPKQAAKVRLHAASAGAIKAIEKSGGSVEIIKDGPTKTKSKDDHKQPK